jgi:hypothetical protein
MPIVKTTSMRRGYLPAAIDPRLLARDYLQERCLDVQLVETISELSQVVDTLPTPFSPFLAIISVTALFDMNIAMSFVTPMPCAELIEHLAAWADDAIVTAASVRSAIRIMIHFLSWLS